MQYAPCILTLLPWIKTDLRVLIREIVEGYAPATQIDRLCGHGVTPAVGQPLTWKLSHHLGSLVGWMAVVRIYVDTRQARTNAAEVRTRGGHTVALSGYGLTPTGKCCGTVRS